MSIISYFLICIDYSAYTVFDSFVINYNDFSIKFINKKTNEYFLKVIFHVLVFKFANNLK